jgi:hypothetical protein
MGQELPVVVMQVTHEEWSKASRGGAAAALRNSVANRRLIGQVEFQPGQMAFECENWSENHGWDEPCRRMASVSGLTDLVKRRDELVQIVWAEGVLRVSLNWARLRGSPGRHRHSGFLELSPEVDSWVQLRWNQRLVDTDTGVWSYEEWTYNVALIRQLSRDIFVRTEPAREIVELAKLR